MKQMGSGRQVLGSYPIPSPCDLHACTLPLQAQSALPITNSRISLTSITTNTPVAEELVRNVCRSQGRATDG